MTTAALPVQVTRAAPNLCLTRAVGATERGDRALLLEQHGLVEVGVIDPHEEGADQHKAAERQQDAVEEQRAQQRGQAAQGGEQDAERAGPGLEQQARGGDREDALGERGEQKARVQVSGHSPSVAAWT